jgi:MFS family permease
MRLRIAPALGDPKGQPSARSILALDWLNFFKADAQTTVGPYLAVFLLAIRHWDAAKIGIAMAVPGAVAVIAQTPLGALVDWVTRKRLLIVLAAAGLCAGALTLVAADDLVTVTFAQTFIAIASSIIPPAIAAVSVGLVGTRHFAQRMGRNEAYSHAGAFVAAIAAGAIAYWFSQAGIFYFAAVMSAVTALAAFTIRERDIDPMLAREAKSDQHGHIAAAGLGELVADRRIAIFLTAVVFFHLANAAMLPLVGEMLSGGNPRTAQPYMSACILVSQLVMLPIAVGAGHLADTWGRKRSFLVGFIVLPIRGLLFATIRSPYFLVATQVLDGVGAGIFGVLSVVVVADLARLTGRFNLLQGAMSTCVAIGAALSNLVGGYIARESGFRTSFMLLTLFALVALLFFSIAMPETGQNLADETALTPAGS